MLVSSFNFNGKQIDQVINRSKKRELLKYPKNGGIDIKDLISDCRYISQPILGNLAKKVKPVYSWNDIILPQEKMDQLREVCQRVRLRNRVF